MFQIWNTLSPKVGINDEVLINEIKVFLKRSGENIIRNEWLVERQGGKPIKSKLFKC